VPDDLLVSQLDIGTYFWVTPVTREPPRKFKEPSMNNLIPWT
jgi:hypothetical protein